MNLRSASANMSEAISPAPAAYPARSRAYGGLVGQMISDIDARMAVNGALEATASPEDFVHSVSVICGYVGLIAGFGAAAAIFLRIL
ncbi:MAG: hypothetical protein JWR80_6987 [Bradyrhizobium sp.]|nr:hypothetical protein [Bradyrhizobium sp.]